MVIVMARVKREKSAMGVYHVLFRAADKLFFSDADYDQFKQLLRDYFFEGTQKLLAYSLSESKIHLIVYEGDTELAKILKPLTTSYARYINRTYQRSGKLFYDRYKSEAVDDNAYLLSCVLYVHMTQGQTSAQEYETEGILCETSYVFDAAGGKDAYLQSVQTGLRVMCMDDYEHMSDQAIDRYVRLLCGKSVEQIRSLEKKERNVILRELTQQKWVSARRLSILLDAGRAPSPLPKSTEKKTVKQEKRKKTPTPKKQPAPAADTGLSVWLL